MENRFLRRREYNQNLVHLLQQREAGHPTVEREFIKSITPNLTIQNVDKSLGYMRKFTPDGKLLLGFSADQRSAEVYEYRGVGCVAHLLAGQQSECITAADHSIESLHIRQQIFQRLLLLRWTIRLAPDTSAPCHLNREFSIFLDDGRYVLLAAMAGTIEQPPYSHILDYPDLYDGCELFTYTFYLVDLQRGCKCDELVYKHDCIMLSHNHGVSVSGQRIAVLSKFRQCVELLELAGGKLVPLYTVGPYGCAMDGAAVASVYRCTEVQLPLGGTLPLSHLKQSILSYLYREALQSETKSVRSFYKMFKIYENMVIAKMQLIGDDLMLMRFEPRPTVSATLSLNNNLENLDFKLYVFYVISTQKVLKIFAKNSIGLLYLLRDFCDNFRNVRSLQTLRPSSSPSNNPYFRAAFNNAITSLAGGQAEAALRFNPTLPISTQSFATTQYLDYSLFNYDDRLISALERPKSCSAEPIRFSDRNTNITKFRLHLEAPSLDALSNSATAASVAGVAGAVGLMPNRELVAFIFHPYEPFIISIQKLSLRYVVNFHIHNKATIVQP